MNFFRFFILFSSFSLIVWGALSASYPSRRNALSEQPSIPDADEDGNYDDDGELGDDSLNPPQKGFQEGLGPVTRPTDLGYTSNTPEDQSDLNDVEDDANDSSDEEGVGVDNLDALRDDSKEAQASSRRQGFKRKQEARRPERLKGLSDQDQREGYADEDLGVGERDALEQIQSAPREYSPAKPKLKFGQTGWNQIDVHSLVRDRSFYLKER